MDGEGLAGLHEKNSMLQGFDCASGKKPSPAAERTSSASNLPEEIERSIDKELLRSGTRLSKPHRYPDGSVLEVNHVDEGQPTEFWYAKRWKQLHGSRKAAALAITLRMK